VGLGGTALFCPPKHFDFLDPKLELFVYGDEITVTPAPSQRASRSPARTATASSRTTTST
jgi:hypothetical protein